MATDGQEIAFAPDESVHVHEEGAIRLICANFRSHEDGLPEWIKNSSDMYRRQDVPPTESVILLLLKDGTRNEPSLIGCLDFGGMTTADIEKKFRNWADPDAAGKADGGIEGGHGNGGKCYMTQMFSSHSFLHTVKDNRGNRYGFKSGTVKPGYFPSATEGRGFAVDSPDAELNLALKQFALDISKLPDAAKALWNKRKSFTLVLGVGAKLLPRSRFSPAKWVENLQGHQQMAQSIQRNHIFVAHSDGRTVKVDGPLSLPAIVPIPGAEQPRIIEIPDELIDPLEEIFGETDERVSTGAAKGKSVLVLRTSNTGMRRQLKARHTINGWTTDNRSTGYWEVPSLARSGYAQQIYGDIFLDTLADYKQNDRKNHSDAPLTRAVREWISQQIEAYSAEFVKLDKMQASKEQRAELSRLNDALNAWKNKFLEKEFGGIGQGSGDGTGEGRVYKPRLPRGEPARLLLSVHHRKAGQGVTFRPNLDFYDANGGRIRAVAHDWESSDWAVATVDADLNVITTHSPGVTSISAVCKNSGLRSNAIEIEVLNIGEVTLSPPTIEVRAGSRQPVAATVRTKDGQEHEGVYLIWTEDNRAIVSVGSNGMVFGLMPGATTVTAGDNQTMANTATQVTVIEADKTKDGSSGFPRILVSEIDNDPLGETPPIFSSAEPPVHQRPQDVDHNIWWINMASPLARRYFEGGGAKSREWRVYHLERYIEIMVKIILHHDFMNGEDVSFETMLRRWEEESIIMQTNAVATLQDFLEGSEVQEAA